MLEKIDKIKIIKNRENRCFGHEVSGIRIGRPKKRWLDEIENNIRIAGCMWTWCGRSDPVEVYWSAPNSLDGQKEEEEKRK